MRRPRPPVWLAVTLLSHFLVQLGVSMARPVTSYRMLALGADAEMVGLVGATFALPAMFLAVFVGRLTDRRHPGITLTAGAAIAGFAVLGLSRSDAIWEVAVWVGMLGIGHLAVVLGAQSLIAQDSSGVDNLTSLGLLTVVAALAQMAGPVLGGLLSDRTSGAPTAGSTGLALAVAGWVAVAGFGVAAIGVRARRPPQQLASRSTPPAPVAAILRTHGLPATLLASLGSKGAIDLVTVYLPVLGTRLGIGASVVGVLLGISSGSALLARAAMPWFVRRVPTWALLSTGTAASALCIALLPLGGGKLSLGLLVLLLGFSLALVQTVSMVRVVELAPSGGTGSALGTRLAFNRAGQMAVPGFAGVTAGAVGLSAMFGVTGLAIAAIAIVLVRYRR